MTKFTPSRRKTFMSKLREMPNIARAARTIGLSRTAIYKLREGDKDFAQEMDIAIDEGVERLEEVAMERATKSSDPLLMFLLKAHRPEKYRERVELGNIDGQPITVKWDDREQPE